MRPEGSWGRRMRREAGPVGWGHLQFEEGCRIILLHLFVEILTLFLVSSVHGSFFGVCRSLYGLQESVAGIDTWV